MAAVIGFFAALFGLSLGQLMAPSLGISHWLIATAIVLVVATALYLYGVVERLYYSGWEKLDRGFFNNRVKATLPTNNADRWYRNARRIAYFTGALLAFALSSILTPGDIMDLIPWT
ncbi:MAG: hypothetical protein AAF762_08185 [Pseudomonadota bacterium]